MGDGKVILFISGPYRGDVEGNIARARAVAVELWKAGHVPLCPHLNTYGMEKDGISDECFLAGDLALLERCDGIVMIEGWRCSEGAWGEYLHAERLGLPIYFWPDVPEA